MSICKTKGSTLVAKTILQCFLPLIVVVSNLGYPWQKWENLLKTDQKKSNLSILCLKDNSVLFALFLVSIG